MKAFSQQFSVSSPNKTIIIKVSTNPAITYSVWVDGKETIASSAIDLKLDNALPFVKNVKAQTNSVNEVLRPVVKEKKKEVENKYNELILNLNKQVKLAFRAFDNGVAYRWMITASGDYKVVDEEVNVNFSSASKAWYPLEKSFYSHNERTYVQWPLDSIDKDKLASLPALVDAGNVKVLLTESDLFNYPGLWIVGNGRNGFHGTLPQYPLEEKETSDRDVKVIKRENFLAKLNGPQQLPWRLLMIAKNDGDLLTNQLVYQLNRATTDDYSWVKAGKISWDWWNANNITGVDFKSGINNETYKYYIDFASKYGLEYVVLDEGWSDTRDLLKSIPAINMEELTAYAKQKNVGLILWTTWTALDKNMTSALDQFVKWGIKGIKVDFMQRDDQKMVNYYERVAQEAAKRKLLVDFHGSYKPTGIQRLYPNVLTREGVYGLEQNKWDDSKKIDAKHNVTLPFIRMAAGPMDYTPGAMINAQKDDWYPSFNKPMSMGTRCHQLAMYVVYESPLQMLADNPTNYYKEPECMEFLSKVPVEWNDTKVLNGKVGEYVTMARNASNGDWYIGAMNNWTARELEINLSFLDDKQYKITIWKDGVNAARDGIDYKMQSEEVNKNSKLKVLLAPGGGWVGRITAK
nr:glycoside hydrolase family 97 protein [Solitalea lacus]